MVFWRKKEDSSELIAKSKYGKYLKVRKKHLEYIRAVFLKRYVAINERKQYVRRGFKVMFDYTKDMSIALEILASKASRNDRLKALKEIDYLASSLSKEIAKNALLKDFLTRGGLPDQIYVQGILNKIRVQVKDSFETDGGLFATKKMFEIFDKWFLILVEYTLPKSEWKKLAA